MQLPPPWDPKWFRLIDDPIDWVRQDTQVGLKRTFVNKWKICQTFSYKTIDFARLFLYFEISFW